MKNYKRIADPQAIDGLGAIEPLDIRVEKLLEFSKFLQHFRKDLRPRELEFLNLIGTAHPGGHFFEFMADEATIKMILLMAKRVNIEENCAKTLEMIHKKQKKVSYRVKHWFFGLIGH